MFSLSHLHALRAAEFDCVVREFPRGARILEIGAGTGYQAKMLEERGFCVTAIDVATSEYAHDRVFPVIEYDGTHLPLADGSIDVVFSSNALEHVDNLDGLMGEAARVLAPDGIAVHILPSVSWRFWTLVSGWLDIVPFLIFGRPRAAAWQTPSVLKRILGTGLFLARGIAGRIIPVAHGSTGNAITELWGFRRGTWRRRFERQGYRVAEARPMGMFYTGFMLFGSTLSLETRRRLAPLLGSACVLYRLFPPSRP